MLTKIKFISNAGIDKRAIVSFFLIRIAADSCSNLNFYLPGFIFHLSFIQIKE